MSKKKEIGRYMLRKIEHYKDTADYSSTKAELAKLRRGIGHQPGELPELYGYILRNMPESFWSSQGRVTQEEWSCYIALTLYALHQQGNNPDKHCVNVTSHMSLGNALRAMVKKSNDSNAEERMEKRLQMLITSNDMREFSYHLKSLVSLLRSEGIALNYSELAEDIYDFQIEELKNQVCLRW